MKKMKFLSIVLCMSMVLTNPCTIYAEQIQTQMEAVSENETAEEVVEAAEETVIEDTVSEPVVTEESSVSEDAAVSQNVAEQSVSGDALMGFCEMELTQSMRADKAELKEVADTLSEYTAGEDYIEDQAVILADTREEAEEIAECYHAEIVSFEYGVATLQLDNNITDVIKLAADTANSLPAVYPNVVYTLCDEITTDENADEKTVSENAEDPLFGSGIIEKYTAPNDPLFAGQWQHTFIDSASAWNTVKGDGVTVAVLDTGVDSDHEDLVANLLPAIDTTNTKPSGEDGHGHGTHVAGIIAAAMNNGKGGTGVAPLAKILPVKVLTDKGSSSTGSVAAGIGAAIENNADVINMSLGGAAWDALQQKQINKAVNAGVVVVCAAGNESQGNKAYPAACDNVISVAALAETSTGYGLADYSNWGNSVDIAAPGSSIMSTTNNGKYGLKSGTSMACPVTAGIVALIMSSDAKYNENNKAAVDKVTNILLSSMKDKSYSFKGLTYSGSTVYRQVYGGADAGACLDTIAAEKTGLNAPVFKPSNTDGNDVLSGEGYTMELSTDNARAKIYYTYDGKVPSKSTGYLYTGPIRLNYAGKYTFKAVAVIGSQKSAVTTYKTNLVAKAKAVSVNNAQALTIAPGKKIQLVTEFVPAYTTNQQINWTSDNEKITVDKKGVVTCAKDATGSDSAKLTGVCADGSGVMTFALVYVSSGMTTSLTLKEKSVTMTAVETTGTAAKSVYGTFDMLKNLTSDNSQGNYVFTSSNKKVATVDSKGIVTAQNKGKAVITVKANDGSNKTVKCKVNVIMPVYGFSALKTATGFYEDSYDSGIKPIAKGTKIKVTPYLNADVSYSAGGSKGTSYKPSNSKIIWSSSNSKVTVKNGVVSCSKDASGTAVITAKAADGYGATETMTFTIYNKPQDFFIRNAGRKLKSVKVKMPHGTLRSLSSLSGMIGTTTSGTYLQVRYQISNPDVADVVYDNTYGWIVVGVKPGKCTITYKTFDGSNKSVKFNITVN